MEGNSRGRVTITLGRNGGVVKRAGFMSDADSSNSSHVTGKKRSIRDRLGSNFESTKRQRGEDPNAVHVDKNDLRFKLMQKKNDEDQKIADLRERLLRTRVTRQPPPPSSSLDSRQRMPQPKGSRSISRQMPSTRSADDLQSSRRQSYSPWAFDDIIVRRRSPDGIVKISRGVSPPRIAEGMQRRPSSSTYDDVRAVPYISKGIIDSQRPASSSAYMTKPVLPSGSGKPLSVSSLGQSQVNRPPPGPPSSSIVQKVSYVPEEPQTVDGLLHSLGLGKYVILFKAEEIDMSALKQMRESDLKELGIPMGPRKKILLAVLPRSKRYHT